MVQRYPIAYVRRSSADANNPGDVSREAQENAVHELAKREGHNGDLRILTDWDRSADEAKESSRTAFLAMLAAIERGEVSAVYAASLDRLYRSLRTFVRLTDAAKAHDVRIVTLREGVLGGDGSPMAQAFAEITAVFSGLELRTTKARAAGALAVRRHRGDHIGRVGYGYRLARNAAGAIVAEPDPEHPLEPIIEAVREAGSILGGAKLLGRRGVPPPAGGPRWGSTTLRRIIERAAPELVPTAGPSGRRTPTHSVLAQLLVCHCGHVLTPDPSRHAYRCTIGNRTGREAHGPLWVSEKALLPWLKAEAARVRLPRDVSEVRDADKARALDLSARRARIVESYIEGLIDKEDRDARLGAIDAELETLEASEVVLDFSPTVDWSWDPERLGAVLRTFWRYVQLGPDLLPVSATWRLPPEYVAPI
jgi:DNA invertase Pin-like site-specific DNA recombinase